MKAQVFLLALVLLIMPLFVAPAFAASIFGFLGLDSITDALLSIAAIVITFVIPPVGRAIFTSAKRRAQAEELDMIADGIVAMVRRNNPGNKWVEIADTLQNQIFDTLKATPTVTNSESVLQRVAASAIQRALDAAGVEFEGE